MRKPTPIPWQRDGSKLTTVPTRPHEPPLILGQFIDPSEAALALRAVNSHSALLAALRTVEWAAEGYAAEGLHPACPACRAWQSHGHAPDCQLAKALRDAEGETE